MERESGRERESKQGGRGCGLANLSHVGDVDSKVLQVLTQQGVLHHVVLGIRVDVCPTRSDGAQLHCQGVAGGLIVLHRVIVPSRAVPVAPSAQYRPVSQVHPQVGGEVTFGALPSTGGDLDPVVQLGEGGRVLRGFPFVSLPRGNGVHFGGCGGSQHTCNGLRNLGDGRERGRKTGRVGVCVCVCVCVCVRESRGGHQPSVVAGHSGEGQWPCLASLPARTSPPTPPPPPPHHQTLPPHPEPALLASSLEGPPLPPHHVTWEVEAGEWGRPQDHSEATVEPHADQSKTTIDHIQTKTRTQ